MRRSAAKEGSIVEIACDESGFSGGNLVGPGASTVFAHAGVHVDERSAGLALAEIRASLQARSDGEYKSAELMRARHRPLLLSFLGPSGPIAGRATVIVIDTRFFVLARLLDVLLGVGPAAPTELPGRDPGTHQMADRLYRSGAETYGAADWQEFLQLAGNLLRTNSRWLPARPVENFYATLDRLLATDRSGEVAEVLDRLRSSRPIAEQVRSGYSGERQADAAVRTDHPRRRADRRSVDRGDQRGPRGARRTVGPHPRAAHRHRSGRGPLPSGDAVGGIPAGGLPTRPADPAGRFPGGRGPSARARRAAR